MQSTDNIFDGWRHRVDGISSDPLWIGGSLLSYYLQDTRLHSIRLFSLRNIFGSLSALNDLTSRIPESKRPIDPAYVIDDRFDVITMVIIAIYRLAKIFFSRQQGWA